MTIFRRTFILPLAAIFLAVGACDDPTLVEEEHFDVEGFALVEGDTPLDCSVDDDGCLYRYVLDDGLPPTLTLDPRAHDVVFALLDHDGDPLPEDDEEHEEHELLITISDASILTWTAGPHDDDEPFIVFPGVLTGLQEGTTTMTVCVPHEGHCDFEADITVNVTAQ